MGIAAQPTLVLAPVFVLVSSSAGAFALSPVQRIARSSAVTVTTGLSNDTLALRSSYGVPDLQAACYDMT